MLPCRPITDEPGECGPGPLAPRCPAPGVGVAAGLSQGIHASPQHGELQRACVLGGHGPQAAGRRVCSLGSGHRQRRSCLGDHSGRHGCVDWEQAWVLFLCPIGLVLHTEMRFWRSSPTREGRAGVWGQEGRRRRQGTAVSRSKDSQRKPPGRRGRAQLCAAGPTPHLQSPARTCEDRGPLGSKAPRSQAGHPIAGSDGGGSQVPREERDQV